jgi:hypothetical protein
MWGARSVDFARSGGWIVALLERLSRIAELETCVACVAPGLADAEIEASENLRFFSISQGPARRLFAFRDLDNNPRYLDACLAVIHRVKPDIIHVHGTERFYGLIGAIPWCGACS